PSVRKRLIRKGTLSIEKVLGADTISRTRVVACAAKAITPARNRNQKASVAMLPLFPLCPLFSFVSLSPLYGLDDGGNDLEEIPDDPVVRDLEDGRVGILVDGDDGAGSLHADQMLDRARDAEREIELRRDGLAGAADLALHRQPSGVADGARRRDLGAERLRELLGDGDVRLLLDPAAHRHDPLGLRQIDRLLRLLERRL